MSETTATPGARLSEIAAVGERDLILPLLAVGARLVEVANGDQAVKAVRELVARPETGIVLVTESIAAQCVAALDTLRSDSAAAILVIPTHRASKNVAYGAMRDLIARAVGVDLLGKASS